MFAYSFKGYIHAHCGREGGKIWADMGLEQHLRVYILIASGRWGRGWLGLALTFETLKPISSDTFSKSSHLLPFQNNSTN